MEIATFLRKCKRNIVHFLLVLLGVIEKKAAISAKSKRNKSISGIVIAISLMVLGWLALPSFWFWVCWEIIAGVCVTRGCIAEWHLLRFPAKPGFKAEHRASELRAILAVSIGVTMELIGVGHSVKEGARLEALASQANEQVAILSNQTAQLVQSNLSASLQIEELRSNNLVLEKQLLDIRRRASPRFMNFDWDAFVQALKGKPKKRVELLYQKDDVEGFEFAREINNALKLANWTVSAFRPVVEEDIQGGPGLFPTNAPLVFRAGAGLDSLSFVVNDEDFSRADNPNNSFGAFLMALRAAGVNTSGSTRRDSTIPNDLIRFIVGPKF